MTRVSLYNIKQRSPSQPINPIAYPPHQTAMPLITQNPIAYSLKLNSDRPSPPTKPDRLFPTSNSDRPSTPTKPDRLFLNIKQRSHLTTTKQIAYFRHQTAISSHHP
jgi:hypothetical protein